MRRIVQVRELQRWSDGERAAGRTVGLVPTMGALHAGHMALVERARSECDRVVVSIFVNPTQFGPNEDLDRYPRTPEADAALLEAAGVDVLFAPTVAEIYPLGENATWVTVAGLDEHWCGASRPGHFRGVATVVTKLLHAAKPHRAYFGEKDFQQLAIVRRLARELLFDVEIVGVPTVRESDGLALSSRNAYLDAEARAAAPAIHAALVAAQERFAAGERDAATLLAFLRERLAAIPGARLDYVGLADPETLAPIAEGTVERARILCAVHLGGARLIDNLPLEEGASSTSKEGT